MRKDKIRAYELRRSGQSYKQIHRTLGVPLSTLAGWFKNEEWSQKIRAELGLKVSFSFPKKLAAIQKANKLRWAKLHQSYRDQAEKEFEKLKDDPLFVAGLMLYWGEGDKTKRPTVKFANSDPRMVALFYRFLKNCIRVPPTKIRAHLLLYPDLKDEMQKTFWHRATGIPQSQFWKSVYITKK